MPVPSSCIPKPPLMTLGAGQPAVLDYNLPQSTCLTALGRIPLPLAESMFRVECCGVPADNYWQRVENSNADDIARDLERGERGFGDFKWIARFVGEAPVPWVSLAGQRAAAMRRKPSDATESLTAIRSAAAPAPKQGFDYTAVVEGIGQGYMPLTIRDFSGQMSLCFLPRPVTPLPRIMLIETYRMCSYLGDYGAGKTLNTFSLLPGEKTEITIRTYRDVASTSIASENILDSFSETSRDAFQSLVEQQQTISVTESQEASAKSAGVSLSASVVGAVWGFITGNTPAVQASHGKETTNVTSSRTDNASVLNRALEQHVEETSYAREVDINTSTQVSVYEGEETSTVRMIENINESRVLNFVFRQMLQEYITITWLDEVRVVYTNGYPESTVVVELHELSELLPNWIKPEHVGDVTAAIVEEYEHVHNWRGEAKQFIEGVEQVETMPGGSVAKKNLAQTPVAPWFYRKVLDLEDEVKGISVPGVILSVRSHVLRTPAVIVEALLGQGEALDCYNAELQDAAVARKKLENRKIEVALDTLEAIEDPEERARAYGLVFFGQTDEGPEQEDEEE